MLILRDPLGIRGIVLCPGFTHPFTPRAILSACWASCSKRSPLQRGCSILHFSPVYARSGSIVHSISQTLLSGIARNFVWEGINAVWQCIHIGHACLTHCCNSHISQVQQCCKTGLYLCSFFERGVDKMLTWKSWLLLATLFVIFCDRMHHFGAVPCLVK